MSNNDGAGAARPKSGDWACAIVRSAGYRKTEGAMGNRTRSRHKGTGKHDRWEGAGTGTAGNVNGYMHGNSGGGHGGGSGY